MAAARHGLGQAGMRQTVLRGSKAALKLLICMLGLWCGSSRAIADNLPEYQIKAAFWANFATFTVWPENVGNTLNLCVYGPDPFGTSLDNLQNRMIGRRSLTVTRVSSVNELGNCQIVFITRPVIDNLLRVLDNVDGKPVLTIADSPGAMRQGVIINMGTKLSKVTFEANLAAARGNGLNLSSKLLSLASEVKQ